jgi:hypothetical protein
MRSARKRPCGAETCVQASPRQAGRLATSGSPSATRPISTAPGCAWLRTHAICTRPLSVRSTAAGASDLRYTGAAARSARAADASSRGLERDRPCRLRANSRTHPAVALAGRQKVRVRLLRQGRPAGKQKWRHRQQRPRYYLTQSAIPKAIALARPSFSSRPYIQNACPASDGCL